MIAYAVRRLLWGVVLILLMTWATFVIFFVVPPDRIASGRGQENTQASIQVATGVGSGPIVEQWAQYIWNAVGHQSLGKSARSEVPVTQMLTAAVPVTASLLVGGTLLFLMIAIPVGILSALRPRSLLDRFATILVLIGIAAHPAWIGLILAYVVGYKWQLTPIGGYCEMISPTTQCGGFVQWGYHLLLPWFTFAVLFAAVYARMIRAAVIESSQEEYVRTARAKGGSGLHVLRAHVLRNAAIPVVMMLGMDMGLAFAGTLFVEQVYSLPGMGKTLATALNQRDFPVMLGFVTVVCVAIAVFMLIADICYAALDPRVRLSSASGELGRVRTPPTDERPRKRLLGARPQSQRSTASP